MTTSPEEGVTRDLAELQRLPEDERPPGSLDPTCATTGVGGRNEPGADSGAETEDEAGPEEEAGPETDSEVRASD